MARKQELKVEEPKVEEPTKEEVLRALRARLDELGITRVGQLDELIAAATAAGE